MMVSNVNHPQMALIQVRWGRPDFRKMGGLNLGEWNIVIYADKVDITCACQFPPFPDIAVGSSGWDVSWVTRLHCNKHMANILQCLSQLLPGRWFDFFFLRQIRNVIIPTDFPIFQRGWNHQPVIHTWPETMIVDKTSARSTRGFMGLQLSHYPCGFVCGL